MQKSEIDNVKNMIVNGGGLGSGWVDSTVLSLVAHIETAELEAVSQGEQLKLAEARCRAFEAEVKEARIFFGLIEDDEVEAAEEIGTVTEEVE